jgi:hypothetical protein
VISPMSHAWREVGGGGGVQIKNHLKRDNGSAIHSRWKFF